MLRKPLYCTLLYSLILVIGLTASRTLGRQAEVTIESSRAISSPGPRPLVDYDIPGLDTRVNLRALESWDVAQLIEFLAHRGGIQNIVIGRGVAGLTTRLRFDDVSVGEALEVVLSVNNLAYTIRGEVITIMSDEEYQRQFGTSFYDQKEVRMLQLKYADPIRVQGLLDPIRSSIGTVVADQATGALILIDTPAKTREMESIALAADLPTLQRQLPTETKIYVLQHSDVTQMQNSISPVLTPDVGRIRYDQRTRTLIVTDLPHKMREIDQLVTAFDRRGRQVFIEAKIVQVSLSDQYQLGVDWHHVISTVNPRADVTTRSRSGNFAMERQDLLPSPTGQLTYRTLALGGNLEAVIRALQSVGETKSLSNPHIAVLDGERAEFNVVDRRPYAEAQLESGSTNVVGETFQFIDVGVRMDVIATINDHDMISMEIAPSISSVIGEYTGGVGTTVPIVREARAETRVMVKNGETIIIAGMIFNESAENVRRVPLLGRVPLFSLLFKHESQRQETNELIVFLTPRIVSGERPYLRMRDVKKAPKPMRRVASPESERPIRGLR